MYFDGYCSRIAGRLKEFREANKTNKFGWFKMELNKLLRNASNEVHSKRKDSIVAVISSTIRPELNCIEAGAKVQV